MSDKLKILHIAGWLPSPDKPSFAPFVKRQIDSLESLVDQDVWHLEIERGAKFRVRRTNPEADRALIIQVPTKRYLVLECIAQLGLLLLWLTRAKGNYDLIHFHVAYPNCVLMGPVEKLFGGTPIVITEHWSGYHFGFNSKSKGLQRIRAIFSRGYELICVSRALHRDIAEFSGHAPPFPYVVPNIVSPTFDRSIEAEPVEGRFLFVGNLTFPKRPDVLIEVVKRITELGRRMRLIVVGDGSRIEALKGQVRQANLQQQVEFLGRLTPKELSAEYRRAHALLHCSDYETFSVVCAEAVNCGTPVVASRVGGIPEVVTDRAELLSTNEPAEWVECLHSRWDELLTAKRDPEEADYGRLGPAEVGRKQLEVYHQILDSKMCRRRKRARIAE